MSARHAPRRTEAAASADEAAFDEALDHIEMLAAQLHAILALHQPRPALLGPPKCAGCGHRWPCPTVQRGSRPVRCSSTPRRVARRPTAVAR